MISKIRAFSAVLYVLLVIPWSILFMYLFPKYHRKVRRVTASAFFKLFGVSAKIIGELDKTAQVLVMNHQSFMDVVYFEAFHPNDLCWIAKKELGEPFLYGHALKAPKMILINRESKRESVFLLKEAKDRLSKGRVLCIFPEGTRSLGKEKFLPFKSGAKFLIEHFHLKVQPIIFCGTRDCLDIGSMKFDNHPFSIKYLPAFTPNEENWYESLRERMQQEYLKIYQERKNVCMVE
ncbi:lysophospholipid acyltransferase family protein [Helicobacter apodemus]|uniref:1-acyl-sn-glycerol-3-phosphate acyltransferase n=1 Tax=Helicobacter apodemus TaxID=135569 RepID=A0A2U8FDC2_9HELI|nr:lysophospholipid acyltransferase family protein [Helicobacter apodemus]AWI33405.1 1-acyl-sn-glycerol-3-phosphate acyltransferase [Helicobacter apodemus]